MPINCGTEFYRNNLNIYGATHNLYYYVGLLPVNNLHYCAIDDLTRAHFMYDIIKTNLLFTSPPILQKRNASPP